MPYLISNIPHFKCWVRKEFTCNNQRYHGEYLHALAIAVNTIPDRSLSFQVVFTGCEADEEGDENLHGGAMWARLPIQGLVAYIAMPEWPEVMADHLAQPWDCESRDHSVITMDRVSSSPWIAKINHEFYSSRYMFTVDYTDHHIADDPAQHKQSHVMYITEPGPWYGNIVALPNNRVRATSPALWRTGEGAPDFCPNQKIYSAEGHESYTDPSIVFDNLYAEPDNDEDDEDN
tara:strand:- start:2492 stop:3190 length:699 start_codon:yes stop_codon:yes gene_type:complete